MQEMHVPSVGQEDPLEKEMATHSSILAWRIPWTEEPGGLQSIGLQESDTTEWLHFHFSLSCIGEGNGNPLQCSCLENPGDRGAWWASVCGVAQSRTRLMRLSSSISSSSSSRKLIQTLLSSTQLLQWCLLLLFFWNSILLTTQYLHLFFQNNF